MANGVMCVFFLPSKHLHMSYLAGIVNQMVLRFNTSGTFC